MCQSCPKIENTDSNHNIDKHKNVNQAGVHKKISHLLSLTPDILLQSVHLQSRKCELEVRPQVLIDVDERARCHSDGWGPGLMEVHKEGDQASGQVQQRALAQQTGTTVHL